MIAKEIHTFFLAKPLRKFPGQRYERWEDNIELGDVN
jgi:hypothetical protein